MSECYDALYSQLCVSSSSLDSADRSCTAHRRHLGHGQSCQESDILNGIMVSAWPVSGSSTPFFPISRLDRLRVIARTSTCNVARLCSTDIVRKDTNSPRATPSDCSMGRRTPVPSTWLWPLTSVPAHPYQRPVRCVQYVGGREVTPLAASC